MKLSRLALAITLLPTSLWADDANTNTSDELKLPALVITSGRQAEPRQQATAANTIFTRTDIERLQARSVQELLARTPGVVIGSSGGVPSYFLRGTSSAQTLVLVDGQRVASATSGGARLDYLAIESIERVEVIRGPRSALYGADAIGGVIQIFTRSGESGLHPRLRLATGSNQTFQRSLSLSGGNQQTRFNLGASLDESEGFDRTTENLGADSDHDGQRNKALHLKLDHHLSDDWQAGVSMNDQRGKNEYDDAYDFVPGNPKDEFRVNSYSSYLEGQLNAVWNSRLELGRSFDRNKAIGAASVWNNGALETTRHAANWINSLQLNAAHQLKLGADWYEDQVDASTAFVEKSRDNLAFLAQHSFRDDSFSTELGLRHDDNQRYGNQNSWNAAITLPAGAAQRWILSYGEGFRAPTFSDLYYPGAGNPNLNAETSKSYELQWRGDFSGARLEASIYRTDIDDMIAWDNTSFRPENIASARMNGFEASLGSEVLGWQANLGLSMVDPRDRDSGHTLSNRARRTLSLDLDRNFGTLALGATWRAVSSRYANASNTNELSGYGLLDLRTAWQSSRELLWEVKLDNLLDRDYALASYQRPTGPNWFDPTKNLQYQEAGRTALLSLTWTPGL